MLTPASRAKTLMSVASLNHRNTMIACTYGVAARCQGRASWALRWAQQPRRHDANGFCGHVEGGTIGDHVGSCLWLESWSKPNP
jgi:hypothetical protein